MKRKVILFFMLLVCIGLSYGQDNPPFPKEIFLKYKNANLILGYSSLEDVKKELGKPDKAEKRKYGGEDFYWENMIRQIYFDNKIKLIFSEEKNRLIQIILVPNEEDKYIMFCGITEKDDRNQVIQKLRSKRLKFSSTEKGTIWVDYLETENLKVALGFQFNDENKLKAVNFHVNAPW